MFGHNSSKPQPTRTKFSKDAQIKDDNIQEIVGQPAGLGRVSRSRFVSKPDDILPTPQSPIFTRSGHNTWEHVHLGAIYFQNIKNEGYQTGTLVWPALSARGLIAER